MKAMTKKFTFLILTMLLYGVASFGQTAKLATDSVSPGETIVIPLTVTNFINIGAITFDIGYDPAILSYTGFNNPAASGFLVNASGTTIHIAWSSTSGLTIYDGLLLNLNFIYTGPPSGSLSFLPSCEVQQWVGGVLTPITVTYTNGAVNPILSNSHKATLISGTAATGGDIAVPIKYQGFELVSGSKAYAITQYIHYDVAKLSFVNITPSGTLSTAIANADDGIIAITWTNSSGAFIDYPTDKIVLNFVYNGTNATNLEFYPGCIVSGSAGANIAMSYFNGTVSPGTPTAFAALSSISNAVQGQEYEMPLTLTGFPTVTSSRPAAFTLKIPFDSPRLSFIGVTSPAVPVNANVSGSTITITWSSISPPPSINGILLNLKFKYNGVGTASVSFGPGCLFSDLLANTIQVGYTDATISPATASADANIAYVQATAGNTVLDGISFTGLPTNMGAVTLKISYDYNKLTYIDIQNNTYGAIASLNGSTHIITIAWSSPTATDINGLFLNLRFLYNGGGGGGCGSQVAFADGSELANISGTIVPVNWINGGVNLKFKISGYLTYDGWSRPDTITVRHMNVYLKGGAEPLPPALTPVPSTSDFTTTDATGYFEFWTFNGTYYLYGDTASIKAYGGLSNLDVLLTKQYVSNPGLYPLPGPPPNTLRYRTADVNNSGTITNIDVLMMKIRVSTGLVRPNGWKAANWLFSNPMVTVNCANVTQNVQGICSGDVNGSYANPIP